MKGTKMNKFSYSLWVSLILMSASHNAFAGISIDPVQLYLSDKAKQRSATLTLDSKGEEEQRIFEVQAVKWTQNAQGQDIYEPDPSIMINPKNFVLKPNSKQMIRVGFTQPVAQLGLKHEVSWRIVLTEIPSIVKETGINFVFNLSIPLFVGQQEDANVALKLKKGNKNNILNVSNRANSHIQINKLYIVDQQKKEIFRSNDMRYLLPQSQYDFNLGDIYLNALNNYTIFIETDKSEKPLRLKIME